MSILKKSKKEISLVEKAFAKIMPEVKFVDVTPKVSCVACRTKEDIETQISKKNDFKR